MVLAHEAAHIHSDHVMYRTALLILLRLGGAVRLPILAGLPLLAIQLALLEWSRAAELSCDRAAALVTRDPQAVCRALMVLAAGEAAEDLNLDAFIAQGMEYSESGSGLERLTRMLQQLQVTHPMPVRRVRLLLDWVREGDYDRMVRGDYLRTGEEPSAREEADATSVFYADRVSGAFQAAGSSISEVGQQLGDWLKRNRGRAGRRTADTVNGRSGRLAALVELRVDHQQAVAGDLQTVVGRAGTAEGWCRRRGPPPGPPDRPRSPFVP